MFEELIIWGPQVADEHDTLAKLSEKDRAFLAKELEDYERQWPEILAKLREYGMYFKM